ncbi:Pestheic acid cluster transcriptional regulator 3 [Pseudocercospora fuligena]|uniref:Pestheic acid cluster transcriptional regulator 3 n=1 Tax=Pseudocercospora fuligena TaxID=685502 RepID=A0A8H6RKW2_9PEZI|nr:Pestheic acid cluster transcriptional regulator 3 [Pseudocercospora fuligena]
MPFRGRPSRGCETCRRRKIKCDLREGGCEKCEKAGWQCEGYRDITNLMFHDESAKTKAKVTAEQGARRRQARIEKSSSPASGSAASSASASPALSPKAMPSTELVAASPPAEPTMAPAIDDMAIGYFFDKYVFRYRDKRDHWYIEDGNGCLLAAIKALGTAGVMKRTGAGPSADPEARKHYLTALQLTNSALRSQEDVKRDSTLLAIVILGIFEAVSGFQKSLDTWRDHVNGAASLLQLRGRDQFKTQTGCRLYLQTVLNLIISCLSRRIPIPDHVRVVHKIAEQHIPDPKDSVWRFTIASMRLADLNARLLPGNFPVSSTQAPSIVEDDLALYAEIESILTDAPEDWRPQLVGGTGPVVYADYYYVFDSYLVAQTFCGLCSYRIMLIDILRKAMVNCRTTGYKLPPQQLEQVQYCLGSIKQLQMAILAVVPQHLGDRFEIVHSKPPGEKQDRVWTGFQSRDHNPFRGNYSEGLEPPFVRMAGGFQIQFPIFTVGASDPPGGPIRTWVIGVLKLLGQSIGIQQAFVLAWQLEGVHQPPWDISD